MKRAVAVVVAFLRFTLGLHATSAMAFNPGAIDDLFRNLYVLAFIGRMLQKGSPYQLPVVLIVAGLLLIIIGVAILVARENRPDGARTSSRHSVAAVVMFGGVGLLIVGIFKLPPKTWEPLERVRYPEQLDLRYRAAPYDAQGYWFLYHAAKGGQREAILELERQCREKPDVVPRAYCDNSGVQVSPSVPEIPSMNRVAPTTGERSP